MPNLLNVFRIYLLSVISVLCGDVELDRPIRRQSQVDLFQPNTTVNEQLFHFFFFIFHYFFLF